MIVNDDYHYHAITIHIKSSDYPVAIEHGPLSSLICRTQKWWFSIVMASLPEGTRSKLCSKKT